MVRKDAIAVLVDTDTKIKAGAREWKDEILAVRNTRYGCGSYASGFKELCEHRSKIDVFGHRFCQSPFRPASTFIFLRIGLLYAGGLPFPQSQPTPRNHS